jgi:hypothetical protein
MSTGLLVRREEADDVWSDEEVPEPVIPPIARPVEPEAKVGPVSELVDIVIDEGLAVEALGQLRDGLRRLYPFDPEVRYAGDGAVSIWLPELDLYANGASFDDAAWDLVNEVLAYVREWEASLRSGPSQARREGWVRRLELAGSPEKVYRLLFGE